MTDNLSPEDRRKTMQAVKSKGTTLERKLFATLAGMHLKGWRKNAEDIPGKPDVVFDAKRIAIFVDGCFWHGCPHCKRKLPQANYEYWERKIRRNIELADKRERELRDIGWIVIRIWEHEMKDISSRASIRVKLRRAIVEERT